MKKKKLNNSKTEAVPTTDTLAVPEADTSPIASESPDPVTIPETQKEGNRSARSPRPGVNLTP